MPSSSVILCICALLASAHILAAGLVLNWPPVVVVGLIAWWISGKELAELTRMRLGTQLIVVVNAFGGATVVTSWFHGDDVGAFLLVSCIVNFGLVVALALLADFFRRKDEDNSSKAG